MRIIGGLYRGSVLLSPKGESVRPTSGRAKEALFNILNPRIAGARFLDLFGGAGAIGLEAASRGAGQVVIVEKTKGALIEKNIEKLKIGDSGQVAVMKTDVVTACGKLESEDAVFDIVFADPPWEAGYEETALSCCERLLTDDGLFILEAFHKKAPPGGEPSFSHTGSRRYGDTAFHFYQRKGA